MSARPCLLLACLLSAACAADDVVEVSVTGLTDAVRTLEVRPVLEGHPADGSPLVVTRRLDDFLLHLPAGASGHLDLHVAGRDEGGCAILSGDAQAEFGNGPRDQLQVALQPLEETGCRIELRKRGEARGSIRVAGVTAMPCGSECASADLPAPPGTEVTLSAVPDRNAYFSGWTGACAGRLACRLTSGSEPLVATANFIAPRLCTSERWCWEHPQPFGGPLFRGGGFSANDVWALVGSSRRNSGYPILHWNGVYWGARVFNSPDLPLFQDLSGSRPDQIFAVGFNVYYAGILARWDGSSWYPVDIGRQPRLNGIWAAGAQDIWMVGDAGTILRWDGQEAHRPAQVASPVTSALRSIWGASSSFALAAGDGGAVLRWDGTSWVKMDGGTTSDLNRVWGTGSNFAVGVGKKGALIEWNGTGWSRIDAGTTEDFNDVWGASADEVLAVGAQGTILRRQAGSWRPMAIDTRSALNGIWGSGPQDVWVFTDDGEIYRRSGDRWDVAVAPVTRADLYDVWGSDPDNVYAVGGDDSQQQGAMMRWDGGAWGLITLPAGTGALFGIWGSGTDDIWAGGQKGRLLHWDGHGWTVTTLGEAQAVVCLSGVDRRHVWAASADGTIWQRAGEGWEPMFHDAALLPHRLWAADPTHVWVVGERPAPGSTGVVLRYDGSAWHKEAIPISDALYAVWGSDAEDVWAAGDTESVIHWDGHSWLDRSPRGGGLPVLGIWGRGPGDVVLVGGLSNMRRRQGAAWGPRLKVWSAASLYGIWGQGDAFFVVGQRGTILRYRP